ncbi:MAG: STM4014 family protein [Azonexus sp.]
MAPPLRLVLLAHPGLPRVDSLQAALAAAGHQAASVVAWQDWLRNPDCLLPHLSSSSGDPVWLKLEAPGEAPGCLDQLLDLSARAAGLAPPAPLLPGELAHGALGHAGFQAALHGLQAQLAAHPAVRCFNPPADILAMADKLACQQTLQAAGVPVPPLLGAISSFEELVEKLRQTGRRRVFVKPRYGSSAAGVVALESDGHGRYRATSSVEMVDTDDPASPRLFNSLRIRRYAGPQLPRLIDALAPHAPYLEQWVPKPRLGRHSFDLRVLTLARQACHRVARLAPHPLTNLHLGNQRGAVEDCLDPAAQSQLASAAASAAACFPDSLMAGVDIIVNRGRAHVLEMNACGDWLPRLSWQGQTVHQAEIALMEQLSRA